MTQPTLEEALLLTGVAADAKFADLDRKISEINETMAFLWQELQALTPNDDTAPSTEPPDGPPLIEVPPDPPEPDPSQANAPWRILRTTESDIQDKVYGSTGLAWDGWYNTAWSRIEPATANATLQAMKDAGQQVVLIVAGANASRDEGLRSYEKANVPEDQWSLWFDEDEWVSNAITAYQTAGVDIGQWVTDGVIVLCYLIDEPYNENSWGYTSHSPSVQGLTAAAVDNLGNLYKTAFGSHVPTVVRASPRRLNLMYPGGYQYQYIDYAWAQYSWTKRFSYNPKQYHDANWWVSTNTQYMLDVGLDPANIVWGIAAQHGGQDNDQPPEPGKWDLPTRATSLTGSNQGGTYMRGEEWVEVADAAVPFSVDSGFAIFRHDDNGNPDDDDWGDLKLGSYKADFIGGMEYWYNKMMEYTIP